MREFMDEDFLLDGRTAGILFHDYANGMPIIDYHCYIDAVDIYENKRYPNLSDAWLNGDHYKWRLMRANGVNEKCITGNASGWEKFQAFAEVLPRAVGNPVYHWTHLELRRFFGCDKTLCPDTAREIWDFCNDKLANDKDMKARGIIKRAQVEIIITTDDPVDNLELHKKLAVDMSFKTKVLPGWSPVAAMDINSVGFMNYVKRLGVAAGFLIENFSDMKIALSNRMKFFSANGCRSCEHSMERLTYMPAADKQISEIFAKRLEGDTLTVEEVDRYQYALLSSCAKEYARLGWVMQLYIGALRNVNSDMLGKLGQDTGFDSVDPTSSLAGLPEFLNDLNLTGLLPKTLIFPIDSKDNLAISTLTGCFTQEGIKGIVQQGSSWWFNDTYTGLKRQILNFAEQGILANFIGMLADSKSFLSYTRHEYFRRILCNIIGGWVDNGLYPADMDHLGSIVRDICYNNAKAFFNL